MKPKETTPPPTPEEMSPDKSVWQRLNAIISLVNLGYATRAELDAFCAKYGIDLVFE